MVRCRRHTAQASPAKQVPFGAALVKKEARGREAADLGPATTGTIGLAPSENLNPDRKFPSLFEPVHGSAPDIFGQNIANPIAMIWAGALMLDFLTQGQGAGHAAHNAILNSIEALLRDGPRTRDLGGTASTTELGEAIAGSVSAA